ncbi:MAG: immunoglobulin domain-containing protein [Armatimonadetes bacterium]|nr:immunoglobulin domain-containing protein [Armatimonadota bacterium]
MIRPNIRTWGLRSSLAVALVATLIACGGGGGTATVAGPSIVTQPSSVSVAEGSAASFSVTASGSDLQYQWYKDGATLSGATTSSYSVAAAATTDIGSYYVVVSNIDGSVSSDVVSLSVTGSGGLDTTIK